MPCLTNLTLSVKANCCIFFNIFCENEARDNCKYEFDYAFEQKGSRFIIPVVLEESMRNPRDWKGPLGAALGKLLYIDLCNVDINDFPAAKTKELVEAIQKKLREIFPDRVFSNK